MNLSDMISKVELGIQDSGFSGDITSLIQEAIEIAAHDLPHASLATSADLSIAEDDTSPVSLPSDYHHDVYRVVNVTSNRPVSIRTNLRVLDRLYDGIDTPGYITDVAVEGTELHFQYTPANEVQTLRVYYYAQPDLIENDDDELDWIPERLHRGIVVDYALKELFSLVEDGVEGQKINTAFYEARYARAWAQLERHTKNNPRQRPVVERSARFF